MPGRRTNLALLALLALAVATGVAAYALGTAPGGVILVAHGTAGLAVALLAPWKSAIVRRGVRRRGAGGATPSLALGIAVTVAIGAGLAHGLGLWVWAPAAGVTAMQVHVGAALVAVPLALWHVAARPVRVRRTDLSRRTLLRAGGLAVAAGAARAVIELPAPDRRFTGSHELAAPPTTSWLDDDAPAVEIDRWRLRVGDREVAYDELLIHRDELAAVLDCTGGWFARSTWRGVRVRRLLGDPGSGRSILVRSATGYDRRFPTGDAESLLLATHLDGEPLSPGHGFPVRLVAPGRRGFWWVKWVEEIRWSRRPWWLQPPFPLT